MKQAMILRLKVTISESKKFARVYELKSDMDLFRFSTYLVNDLGFAPDQMIMFEGYGEDGSLAGEYGLFDMGDGAMDEVTFNDLISREQNVLHFVFDMHTGRYLILTIEGEEPFLSTAQYPRLISEVGPVLTQFEKIVEIEEEPIHSRKRSKKVVKEDFDDEFDEDDEDEDEEDEDEEDGIYDGEEGQEIYGED